MCRSHTAQTEADGRTAAERFQLHAGRRVFSRRIHKRRLKLRVLSNRYLRITSVDGNQAPSARTAATRETERTRHRASAEPFASCNLPQGTMVAAVLKMYFIGTALSVLAVLYGLVDSFGGLMYVQDRHYIMDLDQQTQRPLTAGGHRRGPPPTKNIGS